MLREIFPDAQAPPQSVVLHGPLLALFEPADPAGELARGRAFRPLPKAALLGQWPTELSRRVIILHQDWVDNSA